MSNFDFKGIITVEKVANKIRSDFDPLVVECLAEMVKERAGR